MADAQRGIDATSADYDAMLPFWNMVDTILDGAEAMRTAGELYLPRMPKESEARYLRRLRSAPFTNIYADIVSSLASKPFSQEVGLNDGDSEKIKGLIEDIDGRGNHLHVFAQNCFFHGINKAVDWILVDYSKVSPGATLADERRMGARPYWVHIPAKRMLWVETAMVDGKEAFIYAKMQENLTRRVGNNQVCVERIRELERLPIIDVDGRILGYAAAQFRVWEKATDDKGKVSWSLVDEGPITIGEIALVPFIAGRRKEGSWRFVPPMQDAAHLQIKHYQRESALDNAMEMVCFPMLAANGVDLRDEAGQPIEVEVGPHTVLSTPPTPGTGAYGEWKFVEITGTSLTFSSGEIDKIEQRLRELGRQPLTAQTGNLTVVSTAFAAQKGNSVIEAWALNLKDALEQALKFTAKWLKDPSQPTISWNLSDLDLAINDDKGPDALATARKNGDLSRQTYLAELKRRNILSADFDYEEELDRLDGELPDPDPATDQMDALGGTPPTDPNAPPANDPNGNDSQAAA